MCAIDATILQEAEKCWHGGDVLTAGQLIFGGLCPDDRAPWAASILQLVVTRSGVHVPEIETLLRISAGKDGWREGHKAFDALRDLTLSLEAGPRESVEDELLLGLLGVAENVAKVIYNAIDPPDPFDEDAGWWIADCLKDLLEFWQDDDFSETAWLVLSCQKK